MLWWQRFTEEGFQIYSLHRSLGSKGKSLTIFASELWKPCRCSVVKKQFPLKNAIEKTFLKFKIVSGWKFFVTPDEEEFPEKAKRWEKQNSLPLCYPWSMQQEDRDYLINKCLVYGEKITLVFSVLLKFLSKFWFNAKCMRKCHLIFNFLE